MTDWIEHNGGPQPVADDVWVRRLKRKYPSDLVLSAPVMAGPYDRGWKDTVEYHVLNQHLIDAKQAEIDALKEDLAIWDSVFPDLLPDRLKSDKQLAEEDVAAKIDAARLEGIRLGLEAARRHAEAITALQSGRLVAIPPLDPETIAREAADKETAR